MQFPKANKLLLMFIPSVFLKEHPLLIFSEPAKSMIVSFELIF